MSPEEMRMTQRFIKARVLMAAYKKGVEDKAAFIDKVERAYGDATQYILSDSTAGVLRELLKEVGNMHRTVEGQLLFFRRHDHTLYDMEEKAFERYLIQLTDNVTDLKNQWLPRYHAFTEFVAPAVTTHFLAYNSSPALEVIALNTFDGYMMRRERNGAWQRLPNGTDGILFLTPPEFLSPWQPAAGGDGDNLRWLCSAGHFTTDKGLSVGDQRALLFAWLLHLFVPVLNPVRPIPLFEGITGSGKSVMGELIGRWLCGPDFEVMDLPIGQPAKAEESIKLELCKRPLVVLDNVDMSPRWLDDFLCRFATGVRMSRRRLYTDSEQIHFTPKAGLIVTSRTPNFRREDVGRRILPIQCSVIPLHLRKGETVLRSQVEARRNAIWGDVLAILARFQDGWSITATHQQPNHSLADFSIFGEAVLTAAGGIGEITGGWKALMNRLGQAQRAFTAEEDLVIEILQALVLGQPMALDESSHDLYQMMVDKAGELRQFLPCKSVAAFTKELKAKHAAIEAALKVTMHFTTHRAGQTRIHIARKSVGPETASPQGDNGEDVLCNLENK
jgi:hypothetical protein